MFDKKYFLGSVINLVTLLIGLTLGFVFGTARTTVQAQSSSGQSAPQVVEEVVPVITAGSAAFGTVLSSRLATDEISVKGFDPIKFDQNLLNLLGSARSTRRLQQSAANRGARTRNTAGFADLSDDLARQKGIAAGNQAQQNQLAFSNTAFQRQMAALQGLSGLFGVDTNLFGRTLGIPAELLNTRANASRPSGFFYRRPRARAVRRLPALAASPHAQRRNHARLRA